MMLCGKYDAKNDECQLLKVLKASHQPYVRDIVESLQIPPKRAEYILDKWVSRGWYEYGVSIFAGWLQGEIADLTWTEIEGTKDDNQTETRPPAGLEKQTTANNN